MNKSHPPLPSLHSGNQPANHILKLLDTYGRGSSHGSPPVTGLPAPYKFPKFEYTTPDSTGDKDHLHR
jgi:hypothetical protein